MKYNNFQVLDENKNGIEFNLDAQRCKITFEREKGRKKSKELFYFRKYIKKVEKNFRCCRKFIQF